MRFFLKSFYTLCIIVLLSQFVVNFIGYSELSVPSLAVQNFLFFVYFIPFIHASSIFFTHIYWSNPNIQKIRESQIELREERELSKGSKVWLIISTSLNGILLGFGTILCIAYFFALSLGMFMIGVFASMLSLFFALIFLIKTFHLMVNFEQLFKKKKGRSIAILTTFSIGILISSVSFIPVIGVPFYIRSAEQEFNAAFNPVFGGNWSASIPDSVESHFKQGYFQFFDYFLGTPDYGCIEMKDILFFNGSESAYSIDKAITLYFDAYLPPNEGLPGNYSTIIRIHGGGWVLGDKGFMNIGMMNRYLASQGYVVFDIQYGLNNVSDLFSNIPFNMENIEGNFTLDDMMRHIGNFTYYLEAHAAEYSANLDSVFISGGSAGGQLTCATALSLAAKNYTEFSDAYTIKGYVPFYPGNNASLDFMETSRPEWVDPVLMLNDSAPPCLIFQGNQDFLLIQSQRLKAAYNGYGRTDCALIQFPFAGHGNDIYFPGFYNQIFLYYMERFLYLYH